MTGPGGPEPNRSETCGQRIVTLYGFKPACGGITQSPDRFASSNNPGFTN